MEFVEREVVLAIHDRQLAEHGGLAGPRDSGLLDSALARPVNRHGDGVADRFELAAAYAFGIARNHPFLDGNKRTAWPSPGLFSRCTTVGSSRIAPRPSNAWLRSPKA